MTLSVHFTWTDGRRSCTRTCCSLFEDLDREGSILPKRRCIDSCAVAHKRTSLVSSDVLAVGALDGDASMFHKLKEKVLRLFSVGTNETVARDVPEHSIYTCERHQTITSLLLLNQERKGKDHFCTDVNTDFLYCRRRHWRSKRKCHRRIYLHPECWNSCGDTRSRSPHRGSA